MPPSEDFPATHENARPAFPDLAATSALLPPALPDSRPFAGVGDPDLRGSCLR